MVGIKPGDEVVFTRNKKVVATVVDNKHVEYDGQTMSLTALAKQFLGSDKAIPGPAYFTFKGEKLSDMRKRAEQD